MVLVWFVGVLVLAVPASGQTADEIVDELAFRHYYLGPAVDVPINDIERLVAEHDGFYFVALAADVSQGPDALAADLLKDLGDGTVIVLTPGEVGAVSFDFGNLEVSNALDAAIAHSDASDLEAFVAFADSLASSSGGTAGSPADGGFSWVALLVVGVPLALIGFAMWMSGRGRKRASVGRLEQARAEIRKQMEVIASQILSLADDARVEQHPEAIAHYRAASETYDQADERLASAQTEAELEDLSDDLDRARWELEATDAMVEGRPPPPQPVDEKPQPCFFDPTHGAGVEEAELQTPAGAKKVLVCRADAEKLRRGEPPVPRQIPIGTNQFPAPQAPRSSGGLGMDWLDVFSIFVGGMGGGGMDYDWRPGPGQTAGRGDSPSPAPEPSPHTSDTERSMSRGRRTR